MENENTGKTAICPQCREKVDPKATKCPHCRATIAHWNPRTFAIIVVVGVIILVTLVSLSGQSSGGTSVAPVAPPAMSAEELAAWQKSPAGLLCAKHPTWSHEDCQHVIAKKFWVGMTYDMLVVEHGKPDDVNVSNYGRGNRYQYCWTDYTPSCFYDDNADGVIDSYN